MKFARAALVSSLAVVWLPACSSNDTVVAVNAQIQLPPGIAKADIAVKITQGSRSAAASMPVPSYEASFKIPTGMKDDKGADITEAKKLTISYSTAWFDGIVDHGAWFPMRVILPSGWSEADAQVEGDLSWSALDTTTGQFATTAETFKAETIIPLYPEGAVAAYLKFSPAPPEPPPSDGGAGGEPGTGGTGTGGTGTGGTAGAGTGGTAGTGTGGTAGTGTGGSDSGGAGGAGGN